MDSLCLRVSAVAIITSGSSTETQARANKRMGVQEGAERLTRERLNQESASARATSARAKPGTTIPPYHHTAIPPLCGLMYMHVWSDVCGLTQRVLGSRRCNVKEHGHYGRQCIKNVNAHKVKAGRTKCGKKHSFTGL
jgi:hypothetical protein